MDWPVPRGGDSGLITWPTVAWLLRRAWGQRRFSHKSERCPFGADILPPAAAPVHPRTWGTNQVLRCSNPPCARHDLGLWPIVVAGNTEID